MSVSEIPIPMTADSMRDSLQKGDISSVEIVRACLQRIESVDGDIGGFLAVFTEDVERMAAESDARRKQGKALSEYDGVPIAIKDNIAVCDQVMSCGSRILQDYRVPYHAAVVEKLLDKGIIPIGKTNMDEFAMGSSTENSAFRLCRNPYNRECVPGGSSGGSAAVVAADMVPWSLGSDTGGSIRLPASFCGVLGLKPTYGKVSRYGLAAYGSSLDQIGPMAHGAADAAVLLNIISGEDSRDSTSISSTALDIEKIRHRWEQGWKGLRIGIVKEYLGTGIQPDVKGVIERNLKILADQQAEIREISLPHTDYAVAVYYLIAMAEASSNLSRYDGIRYGFRSPTARTLNDVFTYSRHDGFGSEVKRRIVLGTYILSAGYYDAYYRKASKVRMLITRDFLQAFEHVDCMIAPVSPGTAFRLGERIDDPISMYMSDILTISANLTGLPALSVPGGYDASGMPVGVQIIGKHFAEQILFELAYGLEQNLEYRAPDL